MLANVDDWQISKSENNRKLRDAAYVIPPQPSESETENESDSEDNVPLARLAKKYRQERETSEDEDDIPLMELRKRLKHRKLIQEGNLKAETKEMGINDDILSDNPSSLSSVPSSDSEQEMDVNLVDSPQRHAPKIVIQEEPVKVKTKYHKQGDVKQLLRLISHMM